MKPQYASSKRRPSGQSSIYWGARMSKGFYQTNYGYTGTNDSPWDFVDANPKPTTSFEAHAGKNPTAVHWGGSGTSISGWDATADSRARSYGFFSNYTMAASQGQLSDLINGTNTSGGLTAFDALVTGMKNSLRPVMFRPLWEMNGNYSSQQYYWQRFWGVTSTQYKAAWQRMWQRTADIMGGFTAGSGSGTNTGNISFFWCCNNWFSTDNSVNNETTTGTNHPSLYYPGNQYVDWAGFDGYNTGQNSSPGTLFNTTVNLIRGFAPGKPIAIGETGCEAPTSYTGGKSQWVTDFFAWLKANPDIKFFSWFNEAGNPQRPFMEEGNAQGDLYGITASHAAADAFRSGIADSYFQTNIVNSTTFPNGQKIPIPT